MPARSPRRTAARLAAATAASALTLGGALAVPAAADPPRGHPHGQPPGQSGATPSPPGPSGSTPANPRATAPEAQPGPARPTAPPAPAAPPGRSGEAPAAPRTPRVERGEVPPGNRGTVKVHEVGTSDADRRNEPHVCEFRIVGFGFPADADLRISIVGHGGPNAGPDRFATALANEEIGADGSWAVPGPALADGMYKLAVDNTTAPGGAKQKVFKVDCPTDDDGTDGPTGPSEPGDGGSDGAEEPDATDEATDATPSAEDAQVLAVQVPRRDAALAAPAQSEAPTSGGLGVLPQTGLGLAGLLAAAGGLLGAGAALRRRSSTPDAD